MGANPSPTAAVPSTQSLADHFLLLWQHPELLFGRLALIACVIVLSALLYWIVRRLLSRLHRRLTERSTTGSEDVRRRMYRSLTVVGLLSSILKWVIFLTAILTVLSIAGMNLWPVLTGAGIAGIAIGLGAQSLIRDFLSGFFIILEGQFAVGDYVTVGGVFGVVEEVGLRVTALREPSGRVQYIPNGTIANVTVHGEPRVDYALELELPEAAQAKVALEVFKALLTDTKEEFAPYLVSVGEAGTRTLSGGFAALHGEFAVFPQQEWLATEEIPARLLLRLKAKGLALPDDVKARVYAVGKSR